MDDLPPLSGSGAAALLSNAPAKPALAPTTLRPQGLVALSLFILLALMIGTGLLAPGGWNLVCVTIALVGILAVIGCAISNRPLGALINEQNIMSLSRFQMVLWTIVVLASYLSYALFRIDAAGFGPLAAAAKTDPLNIVIDPSLLVLMGISATSFVAAPMILGTKKDKTPAADVAEKTAAKAGDSTTEVNDNRQGTVYGNTNLADARITDMFQGDELGNTTHVDMAKVQMFFFTIISGVAYLVLVFRNLMAATATTDLSQLPTLPQGIVYALGISHAGYLTSKGIDHTPIAK